MPPEKCRDLKSQVSQDNQVRICPHTLLEVSCERQANPTHMCGTTWGFPYMGVPPVIILISDGDNYSLISTIQLLGTPMTMETSKYHSYPILRGTLPISWRLNASPFRASRNIHHEFGWKDGIDGLERSPAGSRGRGSGRPTHSTNIISYISYISVICLFSWDFTGSSYTSYISVKSADFMGCDLCEVYVPVSYDSLVI